MTAPDRDQSSKRCRCKPYGGSKGMCRVPDGQLSPGDMVYLKYPAWLTRGVDEPAKLRRVVREWIRKSTGEHMVHVVWPKGRRIGGHAPRAWLTKVDP